VTGVRKEENIEYGCNQRDDDHSDADVRLSKSEKIAKIIFLHVAFIQLIKKDMISASKRIEISDLPSIY
jgi:hypothetical protein